MLDWGKIYYLLTLLICERWKSHGKHYFCPLMVNCRIFIILINNTLLWTCPWHKATWLLIGEIISKQVSYDLFWWDPPLKKNRSLKPKPIFRSSLMKFFFSAGLQQWQQRQQHQRQRQQQRQRRQRQQRQQRAAMGSNGSSNGRTRTDFQSIGFFDLAIQSLCNPTRFRRCEESWERLNFDSVRSLSALKSFVRGRAVAFGATDPGLIPGEDEFFKTVTAN